MSISQSQIDSAIANALTKGKRKRVSVDGLTSETEQLSVDELLKLQSEVNTSNRSRRPVLYQRIVPTSRGGA